MWRLRQGENPSLNSPIFFSIGTNGSLLNPLLWTAFIVYVLVAGYTVAHHEMWFDEVHSWNIAKGSAGISDLIRNTRYEGHPPAWYFILWSISKFTHNLEYVQVVHLAIASLSVFLILFFSPFPLITRLLVPFGYTFLFEYAVLSRNYAIGVLLAVCIFLIIRKNFRHKLLLYYILLFLLSNTHLQALLLGASLHLYFLALNYEQGRNKRTIMLHALAGILVALPAVYFIFPPSDSQLNTQFWLNRWNYHKLTALSEGPLRAFLPLPAWWEYNFWNTQFLSKAKNSYSIFRFINQFTAIALLVMAFFIFKKNKKSLVLFSSNLGLNLIVAAIGMSLITGRYAGFIWIAFLAAYWLYCYEIPVSNKIKWVVNSLLIVHLAGGVFTVIKDIKYPFSNYYKVQEFLKQVPQNEKTVTDYWGLNAISAFVDKSFYCIDMQREASFVLWDKKLGEGLQNKTLYSEGVKVYFQREGINKLYMLSIATPEILLRLDPQFLKSYRIKLIDKIEGAIEKSGNLYLYLVSSY